MDLEDDLAVAFRNDEELKKRMLEGVTSTGKVLGSGSYGSVEEVLYENHTCAAKKLHETLIEAGNDGVSQVVHKYLQECQLMASLRHPNITRFLGLCLLPDAKLPLLVMERLKTSLDDLLEDMPGLSLSLKLSFLEDVASGLVYLHDRQLPVIHRDLTAKNVLLTSFLLAKITDMGNSRIVSMRPGQMARTLSRLPGTQVYMPPEALDDTHRYGPALDVFSFGHLSLFTLTQVFPGKLLPGTYPDPGNPDHILGRSEVERRGEYIELLEVYSRCNPDLVTLVKECLHNVPDRRPATNEVLARLQRMRVEVEGKYGGSDREKLYVAKKMKWIEEQKDLSKDRATAAKNGQIQTLQQEMETKDGASNLQMERTILYNSTSKITNHLRLQWRRGPDMPFEMGGYIQSVLVQGKVYVGGGFAGKYEIVNNYTVMEYDTCSGNWNKLPPYRTHKFAMTVISTQLALVGGFAHGSNRSVSKVLGVWSDDSKEWTHPYPEMPTARSHCSAVVYNEWLVVAGGRDAKNAMSCVEVMNTDTKQWYTGPPTPVPWCAMKTAVVGDMCYFMGGREGTETANDVVHSVSLSALVSQLRSRDIRHEKMWKEIGSLNILYSTPLSMSGSLFALGGEKNEAVTDIHLYQPDTGEWVKVGDLPSPPRCRCTGIMINNEDLLVAGGRSEGRRTGTVFTATIQRSARKKTK